MFIIWYKSSPEGTGEPPHKSHRGEFHHDHHPHHGEGFCWWTTTRVQLQLLVVANEMCESFTTDTGHGDIWALVVHFYVWQPCISDITQHTGTGTRSPVAGLGRRNHRERADMDAKVRVFKQQVNTCSLQILSSQWWPSSTSTLNGWLIGNQGPEQE